MQPKTQNQKTAAKFMIINYLPIGYVPFINYLKMERHCTTVYFSLRESKQNKNGESPIEISISANELTTKTEYL